jgi:hypothetical protein
LGREPDRAQQSQGIVGERLFGASRRTQLARGKIGQPTVRIVELVPGHRDGHRVHREVTPAEVVTQIVAKSHDRVTAHPVVRVCPKCRDLQAQAAPGEADRAELGAGGPGRLGPAGDDAQRLVGPGAGGEVEVVTEPAEQGVAYRTADEVQLVTGGGEAPAGLVGDGGDAYELAHRSALSVGQRGGRGDLRFGLGHRSDSLS